MKTLPACFSYCVLNTNNFDDPKYWEIKKDIHNVYRDATINDVPLVLMGNGANSHGQLGQGIQSEECVLPREVDLSGCSLAARGIKQIVGGAGHTLILDNEGHVYSCGWNNKGQLGHSKKADVFSFREVEGKLTNKMIVEIACGWDCSAALTAEGTLFLWGANSFGQLGEKPSRFRWSHEPFEVVLDRRIKRVSMGLRHTALITEDGKVLIAGSGSKGQLGLSSPSIKDFFEPVHCFTEVPVLADVEDIVCGQHHTIAVTRGRDLYVFGDNKHGQLGLNPEVHARISCPTKLPGVQFESAIKIRTAWSHVIILNDGKIISWGRNTYGQLGCTEDKRPTPWKIARMENLSGVQQISTGSEHNVALTGSDHEDGRISCWGWNEHGNCGNGCTKDVIYPKEILLPFNYAASLIGGGAGHSLAVVKKI